MTSRLEKERAKQIQDKCQNLLNQMLRDEDNKYCVDCDAKGPRWASWNLGIFLCIRCAGIHRNLGVHISKVKSVNLDAWTPEQVVSLQQMGNSRARAVYEANLPDSFRRPQTDCSLENFIRAKYEHKKYIAREWVPPPLPKVNWDKELDEEAERQRRRKKDTTKTASNQSMLPPVKKPEVVPQLPKPRSSVSPKPSRANNTATLDLLGLDAPVTNQSNVNGSGDDIFCSFLSASPASSSAASSTTTNTSTTAGKTEEESFFDQPAPSPQEKNKMTKDSILALYGRPSQQPTLYGVPGGMYAQQANIQYKQLPNMVPFGQQSSFPTQKNFLDQMSNMPAQMSVGANQDQLLSNPGLLGIAANPLANCMHAGQVPQMNGVPNPGMTMQSQMMNNMAAQMSVGANQDSLPPNPGLLGMATNPLANCMHVGQVPQMNGVPNPGTTMQSQMVMQMGQTNIGSNNGWSGMLTQNIQPAPGSNPFFNLTGQQQQQQLAPFAAQLPQQMSQMSLGGMNFSSAPGNPSSAAFSGQTLSSNLWQ